jgi:hypothetical protein
VPDDIGSTDVTDRRQPEQHAQVPPPGGASAHDPVDAAGEDPDASATARPWNRDWPGGVPPAGGEVPANRTRQVPDTRSAVVAVMVTLGVFGLAGAAAARVWVGQTELAHYKVTSSGAFLDESQLGLQFGADGWFFVTGLVGGLVVGGVLAGVFRRHGVVSVIAVLGGAALASYLSYQLGPDFGPGALRPRLAAAQVGDLVSAPIEVTAGGVVFSWPIGAMLGALLTQSILWRADEPSAAATLIPNQKR